MITTPWFSFAVAVALGLLIGIERERSKGQGPGRRPAGLRTFTLASLLGAMAFHAGGLLLLGIAIAAVATLAALSYLQSHGLSIFGWYRIILGLVIAGLIFAQVIPA